MSKRNKLAAGAAILVLLLSGFGVFVATHFRSNTTVQFDLATRPRKELMPSTTREWLEEHYTNKLGQDEQVVVHYRDNGDIGVRKFGAGDVLQEETIWFADGVMRAHSVFAADGKQVIDGFMLRDDRTTLWTATNDGTTVTTTTTWYDGKLPFSVEKQAIGSEQIDVQYFYKTGKSWLHYAGTPFDNQDELMGRVTQAELWNNDGAKLMDLKTTDEGAVVNMYRADGTLWYVQHWEAFPWYRSDGGVSRSLTSVDIYDATGSRVVRELQVSSGGGLTMVTDYNVDGSRIEFDISPWNNQLNSGVKIDKEGTRTDIDIKTVQPLKLDDGVVARMNLVDPHIEWKKQETDPSSRTEDGSPVAPPSTESPDADQTPPEDTGD